MWLRLENGDYVNLGLALWACERPDGALDLVFSGGTRTLWGADAVRARLALAAAARALDSWLSPPREG